MDELEFKRHLRDLAHGHHHPEEHDWGGAAASGTAKAPKATAKKSRAKSKPSKKSRPR